MVQLQDVDKVKLKAMVADGGLRSLNDVVRLAIAPPKTQDLPRWRAFARKNADQIIQYVQNITGGASIVLFDFDTITVLRHPGCKFSAEALRTEIALSLSSRLAGAPETIVPRVDVHWLPTQSEQSWIAGMGGISAEAAPVARPPTPPHYASDEIEVDDADALQMQDVVLEGGGLAQFVRIHSHLSGDAERADNYFDPDTRLSDIDVASLHEAARIAAHQQAHQVMALESGAILFPLNVNNLRKTGCRQRILSEIRQLPKHVCQSMEPVLVRCVDGIPQSALTEVCGYLHGSFKKIWVFAAKGADPKHLSWPGDKMAVLVDGLADLDLRQRLASLHAWRGAATKKRIAIGIVAANSPTPGAPYSDITDTICAAM